jgi:hypothetical protein
VLDVAMGADGAGGEGEGGRRYGALSSSAHRGLVASARSAAAMANRQPQKRAAV